MSSLGTSASRQPSPSTLTGGSRRRSTPRPRARSSPARPAPAADWSLLNAGAAIYVGGVAEQPCEGVEKATAAIDSGAARELAWAPYLNDRRSAV